jgi:hypothetical protein
VRANHAQSRIQFPASRNPLPRIVRESGYNTHKGVFKGATKNPADIGDAAYVIDTLTGVGVIYYPMDWAHYRVMFSIDAKVIDTSTGKMVGRGHCFIDPPHNADSPTSKQLMENDAALLKKIIADNTQTCLPKLVEGLSKP